MVIAAPMVAYATTVSLIISVDADENFICSFLWKVHFWILQASKLESIAATHAILVNHLISS